MNSEKKIALIVNYYGMQTGGVETAFAQLMLYAVENGYHVVWLTTENCLKNAAHKEISENKAIDKVMVTSPVHSRYTEAFDCTGERVVVISCEPLTFARAESLRGRLKESAFENYLILPNFRGKIYYPEQFFKGFLHRRTEKAMSRFAQRVNNSNALRAFASQHLDAYEKAYGITVENKPSKLLGGLRKIPELDRALLAEKADQRSEKFEIIACSRFDFPHKAFLLGAVDAYADLKPKYPQLRLTVVGYGEGEKQLKEKINALPSDISADIELTGMLELDKFRERCKNAHLQIGLAGALLEGASGGLPSLVARHFSDTCQTYGFLSDVPDRLRDDEGEDVRVYIENTINMTSVEYMRQTERDYACVAGLSDYHPEYIFEQRASQGKVLSSFEIFRLRMLKLLISVKSRFSDIEEFA